MPRRGAKKSAENAARRAAGSPASLQPRFRVLLGDRIALGPGKAELLRHLSETGSISEAARRMKMSYMRAWSLIQVMNRSFRQPLVTSLRGGVSGGGAQLTPTGRRALGLYQRIEDSATRAAATDWKALANLLRS